MNDLKAIIEQELDNAFIEVMESFKKHEVKDIVSAINRKIYLSRPSKYYDRTGDLKRAFENFKYNISESYDWDTDFYNPGEIHSFDGVMKVSRRGKPYMKKLGHHRSWPWTSPSPDDEEVKENLPYWLNDGFTILKKKYHPGYDFLPDEDFEKEVFDMLVDLATKKLIKKGIL
jgi:hypothetical protein